LRIFWWWGLTPLGIATVGRIIPSRSPLRIAAAAIIGIIPRTPLRIATVSGIISTGAWLGIAAAVARLLGAIFWITAIVWVCPRTAGGASILIVSATVAGLFGLPIAVILAPRVGIAVILTAVALAVVAGLTVSRLGISLIAIPLVPIA
jgi:hypothetical protein